MPPETPEVAEHPSPSSHTLLLIRDSDAVEATARRCSGARSRLDVFPLKHLLSKQHALSERGRSVVEAAASADALLVEWRLEQAPVINTLCYHVRRTARTPVVALCPSRREDALVAAIAAGADDALPLPFSPALLQARILSYHRLVRAARESASPEGISAHRQVKTFGALRLDPTAHRFYVNGSEIELTPREFALLEFLIDRPETLCTRDAILNHVWGIDFDTGTNMVDVYMYFLRRKLEAHRLHGMIQTVRGHGYRLVLSAS